MRGLLFFLIFVSPVAARCDVIVYQVQGNSQISFSGSSLLVPNGFGFSVFPIVAQPASSLSSTLSGTFSSTDTVSLNTGGSISQVTSILGDILNLANVDVGDVSILSSTPIVMNIANPTTALQVGSGTTNYSINSPPIIGSGSYPLNSALFNISNLQFGLQGSAHTASFNFAASALLPTSVNNVFISANVSGSVFGIQSVPEPGSASLMIVGSALLLFCRGRSRESMRLLEH
jgi:hypothetical protein